MVGAAFLAFFICLSSVALLASGRDGIESLDPVIGLIGVIVLGGCIAALGAGGSSGGRRKRG